MWHFYSPIEVLLCFWTSILPVWLPLWSSGQSLWLQIQRSGFDSWRYPVFWEVAGLEHCPLSSPMSTIEELLGRNSSSSGLENRKYGRRDLSRWPRGTLCPLKLLLTSPTSGGRFLMLPPYSWSQNKPSKLLLHACFSISLHCDLEDLWSYSGDRCKNSLKPVVCAQRVNTVKELVWDTCFRMLHP
jgi:hypothetical protein